MKHVAIYARKSVEIKDSVSIDTQIDLCKAYFEEEECTFEVFKDDGYSGANTNRPAFKLMSKKIQLGCFDTLICYKLDRISRKVLDIADIFEMLEKNNVSFVCVKDHYDTSSPMGRAMLYFASVFAQLERETIAERVTDSMLKLAKMGCWTGGPTPRGCTVIKKNGKSYLEITEPEFINACYKLYLEEMSLYSAQKRLLQLYPTIAPPTREGLGRILRTPLFVQSNEATHKYLADNGWELLGQPNGNGYMTYGVKVKEPLAIVGKHTGIVPASLWLNVQKKLDYRRDENLSRESKTYWLSQVLKCPYCGADYIILNNVQSHYYACKNRVNRHHKADVCCNNKYINAEKIEDVVAQYINSIQSRKAFEAVYTASEPVKDNEVDTIKNEMESNNKKIDSLVDKLAILSTDASKSLLRKIEELTAANKGLQARLDMEQLKKLELESSRYNKDLVFDNIMKFDDSLSNEEKRKTVRNIFKALIYNPIDETLKVEFL